MSSLQNLKNIESQNKFVFHGSENVVEEFEPRQAHTIIDEKHVPDGEPAIFASSFVDYAIFMAIVNKKNCPKGFRAGCSWESGKLEFTATKETLDQLNEESSGYVYVFDRSDFAQKNHGEWVSHKKVKPIDVVEVKWKDFELKVR